jgi:transposase-like protein
MPQSRWKKRETFNKIVQSQHANYMWQIDLIGRSVDDEGCNKYIYVCVDHFSEWTEAKVYSNKSKDFTIDFLQYVISKNGSPKTIMSDDGCEIIAQDVQNFAKRNFIG